MLRALACTSSPAHMGNANAAGTTIRALARLTNILVFVVVVIAIYTVMVKPEALPEMNSRSEPSALSMLRARTDLSALSMLSARTELSALSMLRARTALSLL